MQVDLNKLKTFFILAGTKSYTGCAEKLCLTQSAVSHAIKKLEEELGFPIVERKTRTFKLTREGEFLSQRCAGIFNDIDDTFNFLMETRELPLTIRLGAPAEFGSSVLIKGMGKFFSRYPHIHVDFMLDPNLLSPLLMDEVDMIIDCVAHVHEDLETIALFREEYAVIASPDYIAQKEIFRVEDLKACNILSFDKDLLWWKNFINALGDDRAFGFAKVTRISNVRGIINGALSSLGVGFVPRYTILKELEKEFVKELFPEIEVLNDQINIYIKKRNLKKQAFKDLIAHIQSLRLH